MDKLWRVAAFEYGRNVFKKSFCITLIMFPALMALSVGFGLWIEARGSSPGGLGVVDQAGVMQAAAITPGIQPEWTADALKPLELTLFPEKAAARAALEAGNIQAYFILPQAYRLTRHVEVVYIQEPGAQAWQRFYTALRAGLLSGQPAEVVQRVAAGTQLMVRSIDGQRELPANSGPSFSLLMPLFIAMAILIMLLIVSGYTSSAVADEKENRTVEVLFTAVSPLQLMGGKVLGITAISLTLLCSWAGVVILGILVCRQAGVSWFADVSLDWHTVFATLAIAVPAYVLATALMVAIGAMVTTTQEGQALSSVFFAAHLVPVYISYLFLHDPHSSLAVLLSMLPFTSLMTVAMRNLLTIVPAWQVAVSVGVQVICAGGAIWLASRAFRIGMLKYGQRLSLCHVLARG